MVVSFIGGKTGVPGEKNTDLSQITDKHLSYDVLSSSPANELTTLGVIVTDCTCRCKSNYDTITTMTIPHNHCQSKQDEL